MNSYPIPACWLEEPVRISLVGVGGTGSQLAEQLASMQATLMRLGHPGFSVRVFDGDRVSDSNVGRQRFTAADIGLNKTIVLTHRINLFYGLNWTSVPHHFVPSRDHAPQLLITCIDKAVLRAEIGKTVKGDGLWLDCGNGATQAQVILGRLRSAHYEKRADSDVLPNVLDLYPDLADMGEVDREEPSCSTEEAIQRQAWPTNRVVADAALELLWCLFRHGRITHHGAFLTGQPLTITPLAVDPAAWAFMGYTAPRRPRTSKHTSASRVTQQAA